ncbi:MAG TPA: YbaK/EbsC family protein [Acidimicrobiia bacterium]
MPAERVRSYLMEHGVGYETHTHPEAYTISEVAEAGHVAGKEMAKVVMLRTEEGLTMAVVPGDKMVDLEKVATVLRADDVRLAEENEFAQSFPDCETGAEPPFGALYNVPTLVDHGLNRPRITFTAGTHTETITIGLDDYLKLTHPMRADLVIGS